MTSDADLFERRAGRAWIPALLDVRLEAVVLGLLLVTVALLVFGDRLIQRELVFSPGGGPAYGLAWHDDQASGGASRVRADPVHPLAWDCTLVAQYEWPYCGYELRLDRAQAGRGIDLSDFDSVTLSFDYTGPAKTVRLFLKNSDPRYTHSVDSEKYNRVELDVRNAHDQTVTLKLSDFSVAEWWIGKYHIPPDLSRPQFDNIVSIELETGTGAGVGLHRFRVHRIALRGSIVTRAEWYGGILAIWLTLILGFLVYRVVNLRADLDNRRILQALALREADEARREAQTDHLTGLRNRLGLIDGYAALLAGGRLRSAAALLADIDHFKRINDRFGHGTGDAVLATVAQALGEAVGEDGLIGRWGGEEFLALLPDCTEAAALATAERMRASVATLACLPEVAITISVGVSHSCVKCDDLSHLIERADAALYQAKRAGRNRVNRFVRMHAAAA